MARKELMTVKELKAAIRKAKVVLVQPRFGVSEEWIELSKKSALAFVGGMPEGQTPEEAGMYGGMFGSVEDGVLYMG